MTFIPQLHLVLAELARLPRRAIGLAALIVALALRQSVLVLQFRGSLPFVAALHPSTSLTGATP